MNIFNDREWVQENKTFRNDNHSENHKICDPNKNHKMFLENRLIESNFYYD